MPVSAKSASRIPRLGTAEIRRKVDGRLPPTCAITVIGVAQQEDGRRRWVT